jgi:O-antigen ligase
MAAVLERLKIDRERTVRITDGLIAATVAALPWSTSAVSILSVVVVLGMLLTFDSAVFRRALTTPAGGLPALLVLVAILGMAWAVGLSPMDRLRGLESFLKLLVIPLLIMHTVRSERGHWALIGFFSSCLVLLILSWVMIAFPAFPWRYSIRPGIPVRDYIAQSGEFTVCVFVLGKLALDNWHNGLRRRACGLLALAAVFLVNIIVVSFSRTVVMVFPVLLVAFAWIFLNFKETVVVMISAVVIAAVSWAFLPQLQAGVLEPVQGIQTYSPDAPFSSSGLRLEFWRRSIDALSQSPVLGHGTGSVGEALRRAGVGTVGVGSAPAANPHNQIFSVAIQLGLFGTAILFALWMAHLVLFRGSTLVAWTGLVIVIQNIVGSMFNSHLFDFTQGWGYVFGVGVAAGMLLKQSLATRPEAPQQ